MEEVERAEQEAEVQDHCTPKKKRVCRKLAESPDGQGNTIDRYRKFASSDRRQLDYDMWTTEFFFFPLYFFIQNGLFKDHPKDRPTLTLTKSVYLVSICKCIGDGLLPMCKT